MELGNIWQLPMVQDSESFGLIYRGVTIYPTKKLIILKQVQK